MDIDWSKAPDDCAGALQHKDIDYKYTHGRFVRSCTSFDNYEYCISEEIYPCMDFFTLIPRPEAQPVFTQAMADNGELPVVGMECQGYVLADTGEQTPSRSGWVEGRFTGKATAPNGGKCFLFTCNMGDDYVINANSHIKPIDTRTDKEKAIDDLDKFQAASLISNELSESLLSIIMSGKIHGVKWVGE